MRTGTTPKLEGDQFLKMQKPYQCSPSQKGTCTFCIPVQVNCEPSVAILLPSALAESTKSSSYIFYFSHFDERFVVKIQCFKRAEYSDT